MCRARLVERVGAVEVVGPAQAPGWRHRFNQRGRDGTGTGNIQPGDEHVWGVVYRLRTEQLVALDGFEGGYRRCEVSVILGAEPAAVLSYVGLRPGSSLPPADWYLQHYRVGIREHGLPAQWLARVEEHAMLG